MSAEDVKELAEQLGRQGTSPGDATYLRRGVVQAITPASGTATVRIGGVDVAGIPVYRNVGARVGDVVDVLIDGPAARVIGVAGSSFGPLGLIAYAEASTATGGASNGRYGGGWGAGQQNFTAGTARVGCGLGVVGAPSTPGRLLRCRWQLWTIGGADLTNEWYFWDRFAVNANAFYDEHQTRQNPTGFNAPSAMGEFLVVTPAGTTTISAGLDVSLLKNTGTVFRYSAGLQYARSHYTVEDLGPA